MKCNHRRHSSFAQNRIAITTTAFAVLLCSKLGYSSTIPYTYTCNFSTNDLIIIAGDHTHLRLSNTQNEGELCTLIRITAETQWSPVARSYDGGYWEVSAGEYSGMVSFPCPIGGDERSEEEELKCTIDDNKLYYTALDFSCSSETTHCDVKIPPLTNIVPNQSYALKPYTRSDVPPNYQIARLLEMGTFGVTRSDLYNSAMWGPDNSQKLGFKMATWVNDQINSIQPEYHREFYRRRINSRQLINWPSNTFYQPCEANSRWRRFALTLKDIANTVMFVKVAGYETTGPFLMIMDGYVRTMIIEWPTVTSSLGNVLNVADSTSYLICNGFFGAYPSETLGGGVLLDYYGNNGCLEISIGNPEIWLNLEIMALAGFDPPPVLDMTSLSNTDLVPINEHDFQNTVLLTENYKYEHASGDEWLLTISLSNIQTEVCESIPYPWGNLAPTVIDTPIFALLPSNYGSGYALYDPHTRLLENTVEYPAFDGGGTNQTNSNDFVMCSNVPRSFQNEEQCRLSTNPSACHTQKSDLVPNGVGVVVCGSHGEVSNDPTIGAGFTFRNRIGDAFRPSVYVTQSRTIWSILALFAKDQLRQRMAFAFSQFIVIAPVSLNNMDLSEHIVQWYDIFTRNAFGNYFDILKECSFSTLMGQMYTYIGSRSKLFMEEIFETTVYPDENFAREIMQLFTVGLEQLNLDGTLVLDHDGNPVPVYDNDDVLEFARAWTGFQFYPKGRGNVENGKGRSLMFNDAMTIAVKSRDPFPKMDLNDGYIGDRYPLCADLASPSFLTKGAKYRLLGTSSYPELHDDSDDWIDGVVNFAGVDYNVTRMVLDPASSSLYQKLCQPNQMAECDFGAIVYLPSNLECDGMECLVDTVRVVQVTDTIFYEYVRSPCVYQSFFANAKTVKSNLVEQAILYGSTRGQMCADPRVEEAAEACCNFGMPTWIVRGCHYTGERMTFAGAEKKCTTVCDFSRFSFVSCDGCCNFDAYFWSNADCHLQIKINKKGKAAIVHNIADGDYTYVDMSVHGETSTYYFGVKWKGSGTFPSPDTNCNEGMCALSIDGTACLCDTKVVESPVFDGSSFPTGEEILSNLHIGSPPPDMFESGFYSVSSQSTTEVKLYYKSSSVDEFAIDSIFEVQEHGVVHYLKNMKSEVYILQSSNGSQTEHAFRNPPHFVSLVDPTLRDAYHETDAVLKHYLHHDNAAPFIAKQLLKRFGKSNPSPQYVRTVATAFRDGSYVWADGTDSVSFGTGEYGNMASTAAAIMLHSEARSAVLDMDPAEGSIREPLIKVIGFMRSMEYTHEIPLQEIMFSQLYQRIGQMAHDTRSIFSFFPPDYAPNGRINEASLVSPEASLMTSDKIIALMNGLLSLGKFGLSYCQYGFGAYISWTCSLPVGKSHHGSAIGNFNYVPTDLNSDAAIDEMATLLTAGRLDNLNRDWARAFYHNPADKEYAVIQAIQQLVLMPEFHTTDIIERTGLNREPIEDPEPSSGEDYKAVVFLMLSGGFDSYNMLVPHSECDPVSGDYEDLFDQYREMRGSMALNKELGQINPINATKTDQPCKSMGLHSRFSALRDLYDDGDALFLANVGIMNEPISKDNWQEKTPTQLFAHSAQMDETYRLDIKKDAGDTGVLGRMAGVLKQNGHAVSSISIDTAAKALSGHPDKAPPVAVLRGSGFGTIEPFEGSKPVAEILNGATTQSSGFFGDTFSDAVYQALKDNELFQSVLSQHQVDPSSGFGNTILDQKLSLLSRLIKGRAERGVTRDFFFAERIGFDHHSEAVSLLGGSFAEVDDALDSFSKEMKSQGNWDDVTVVVVSDFGRTLTPNSNDGTDHGWAGNYFMVGGSLDGGKIMGKYPSDLTEEGEVNIDRGRLIPTHSWDAVWNGVAQWSGVITESDLNEVLPNRRSFCGDGMLFSEADLYGNGESNNVICNNWEEVWKITLGAASFSDLTFSVINIIHEEKLLEDTQVEVLDHNCTPGSGNDALNAFSISSSISNGQVQTDVTLIPANITSTNSSIYQVGSGTGTISFCLRFSLYSGDTEVAFTDSRAQIFVNLTLGFEVTGVSVGTENTFTTNASQQYTVSAFYCDVNGNVIPNMLTKKQGETVKVCVVPGDPAVVVDKLTSFTWNKGGPEGIQQDAIDENGNAANALTLISCSLGNSCSFETLLASNFYSSSGIVSGSGSAYLKFHVGQRLLEKDWRSAKIRSRENIAIAEISSPIFQVLKGSYVADSSCSEIKHSVTVYFLSLPQVATLLIFFWL